MNQDFPHGDVTERVIGAAMEVHRALGPGLLESAYEVCFDEEMDRLDIPFARQVELCVEYKGRLLDCGYRMDFVVCDCVIVELKCVEKIQPIHEAQLLTYLRLAQKSAGLPINFNVPLLRHGIVRRALTKLSPISAISATSATLR